MYDAIILGTGGMGSAAAAELARRGRRVAGPGSGTRRDASRRVWCAVIGPGRR